jgi:hypothetical protein
MGGGWEAAQDHVQWLAFILVGIEVVGPGGTTTLILFCSTVYRVYSEVRGLCVDTAWSELPYPPTPLWAGLFSSTWRLHSILEPTGLVEDPVPRRCGDCSRNVLGTQATKQIGHQNEQFIFEA